MMKVHRPLCPDITFRLIHDISPDTLGDITDGEFSEKDLRITDFLSETYSSWFKSTEYKDKNAKNKEYIKPTTKANNDYNKKDIVCESDDALRFLEHALKEKNPYVKSNCVNVDRITSKRDFIYSKNELNEKTDNRKSPDDILYTDNKQNRRPRKLPEIPKKHPGLPAANNKSLAEELGDVLVAKLEEDIDDVFDDNSEDAFLRRHAGHLFDKALRSNNSSPKNKSRQCSNSTDSDYYIEELDLQSRQPIVSSSSGRERKGSDGNGFKKQSTSSSYVCLDQHDLEVTHRGMHRFTTRHEDEMMIEIGDPIHVTKEGDDLWCEGVNLRTGQKGIFPAMYATDLHFLEDEEDEEEGEYRKYNLQFLGSVEVTCHKGDEVLCQAVNRVALARRSNLTTSSPPVCLLEISQYGIRMIDKSKEGHESDSFSHFFALKNISFCGTHPRNDRYFAFITKHPAESRFACHVFLSNKSTHKVTDALGFAFKRFYQEYMAFTHPTEDIYLD